MLARILAAPSSAVTGRRHQPQQSDGRPALDDDPFVGNAVIALAEAGLLDQFPGQAGREIDGAVGPEVGSVRRAGREIDPSRIGRAPRHDAADIGAVGAAQRPHGEAVGDGGIGIADVDPGDEIRVIDLEIGVAAAIALEGHVAEAEARGR